MAYGQPALFNLKNPSEGELDNDGYVGVDPIYQNAANHTERPGGTEPDNGDGDNGDNGDPEGEGDPLLGE